MAAGIVLDFLIPLLLIDMQTIWFAYYFAIRIYAEAARVNRQNAQRLVIPQELDIPIQKQGASLQFPT
jgi:hypothetical protein